MAIATFGNFAVNLEDEASLVAIFGTDFDGIPSGVPLTPTEITTVFPSGAKVVFGGSFTLVNGGTQVLAGDPVTSITYFRPGNVLLLSITGITSVTAGQLLSPATAEQTAQRAFDQAQEVFTQGFADVLVGDGNNEIAHTGGGNDILRGNGGNDSLDGEAGADTMEGGTGNDILYVDSPGDVVVELAGQGTDTVRSVIAYVLGSNVEQLELLGTAGISGTGNELNNLIVGNSGNNALAGEAGSDTLDGRDGADSMTGGAGDDRYLVDNAGDTVIEAVGGGFDTVETSVNRTLDANVERLVLVGGATSATGNTGENTLTGNTGDNTLDGGRGGDSMAGGLGNDSYRVDNALDLVSEGAAQGDDTVTTNVSYALTTNLENLTLSQKAGNAGGTGNAGNNVLEGNSRANVLDGGAGNDILRGLGGEDVLIGGAGDDRLSGGAGRDTLYGDAGADKFVFDTAINGVVNLDLIVDFVRGVDRIELSGAIFGGLGPVGALAADRFAGGAGATALDTLDRIVHDSATGMLYYDADGNGAQVMLAFAQVAPGLVLAATDVLVAT